MPKFTTIPLKERDIRFKLNDISKYNVVSISNQSWLTLLQQHRIIAVIRTSDQSLGRQMAQAVAAGGIKLIEITWNTDAAADLIPHLRQALPDCTIGTGTLLNQEQVKQAIEAGAEFLFTPHTISL